MPKRKFSRLNNVEKQTLRGELEAKISVTELARKYGVSRRTIYNLKNRWADRLPQARSKVLTIRVSEEDMGHLDALASQLGMSRASMARSVLLYAAEIYHIEPSEAGEIANLTREIAAIGQNVNQIARAVNTAAAQGQKITSHLKLNKLTEEVRIIAQANDEVRVLMVDRAKRQRAHIEKIIGIVKSSGVNNKNIAE